MTQRGGEPVRRTSVICSLPARLNDRYSEAGDERAARACKKVPDFPAAIWQEPLEQFGSSGERNGKEHD